MSEFYLLEELDTHDHEVTLNKMKRYKSSDLFVEEPPFFDEAKERINISSTKKYVMYNYNGTVYIFRNLDYNLKLKSFGWLDAWIFKPLRSVHGFIAFLTSISLATIYLHVFDPMYDNIMVGVGGLAITLLMILKDGWILGERIHSGGVDFKYTHFLCGKNNFETDVARYEVDTRFQSLILKIAFALPIASLFTVILK